MSESENSEPHIHEPAAFGQHLMLAREEAGMSIDEAARALNLKAAVVEAIEDSGLDRLPPIAFVQGYVRAYAKLLGLPEEQILKEFEQEVPHQRETQLERRSALPEEADSQTPVIKMVSASILVFAVAVSLYAVYSYYRERSARIEQGSLVSAQDESAEPIQAETVPLQSQAVGADDTLIAQFPYEPSALDAEQREVDEIKTNTTGVSDVAISTPDAVELDLQPDIQPEFDEDIAAGVTTEATDAVDQQILTVPAVTPITGGDVLAVSAEQECWAEIIDANDISLFYGMIEPGQDLSLTGQAPFDVFLGNAPAVSLRLNEIDIDMTKYIRANNIAQFKVSVEGGRLQFN